MLKTIKIMEGLPGLEEDPPLLKGMVERGLIDDEAREKWAKAQRKRRANYA